MSGFFTPGVPAADAIDLSTAQVPLDTEFGQGIAPQSAAGAPWQLGLAGPAQALTDGATIAFDADDGTFFSVTLAGNRALAISNLQAGAIAYGRITQDGTGSRTLTVSNGAGGTTLVSGTPLSTSAAYIDIIAIMNVGTFAAPLFAVWPVAKHFV